MPSAPILFDFAWAVLQKGESAKQLPQDLQSKILAAVEVQGRNVVLQFINLGRKNLNISHAFHIIR